MKKLLLPIILIVGLFSCLKEEESFAGFTSDQVVQLITADTLKSWQVGAIQVGEELLTLSGGCYEQFEYTFTNYVTTDTAERVYLRVDPLSTCQADTIGYLWAPLVDEEDEGFALPEQRIIVGTDSGNIFARLSMISSREMEWTLLGSDSLTAREPSIEVRFFLID